VTELNLTAALLGGALIGTSAVLLLWLNGRVAGISGILYGVFTREASEFAWRLLFVIGLIAGGIIYQELTGQALISRSDFPWPLLIVSGLLVGAGTRLGSGCTSGHGICGISRMSSRSIFATATFMIAGIAATTIARHVLGII
jgi:uncharacterized membrane protein YedE/YeeE